MPGGSHFFETLKSKRRLALCAETSESLAAKEEGVLADVLSQFKCLEKFEVRAGDGHWHGAASFDPGKIASLDEDGKVIKKRYPVGHLYTLDLRRHIMRRSGITSHLASVRIPDIAYILKFRNFLPPVVAHLA